jgi:hypothetical protein
MACGTSVARPAGLGYFSPVFVAGRHRGLGVGLLLAGMIALSACGGSGSAPRALPALSTTPAADASTAPPTSRAAELAAVKAVVRRYYALLNRLHIDMNADGFAELMTEDCLCQQQVDAIRNAVARHEHYIDAVKLVSLTAALESRSRADVLVQYNARRGGLVEASGRQVTSTPAKAGLKRFFVLVLKENRWLISEIRAV